MQSANVVLFQSDPAIAQLLAVNLRGQFHSVHVARSLGELRAAIAKHRARVAILDVELSGLADVNQLHQEFPGVAIVCTHRLADEELWTQAINQGADDVCMPWHADDAVRSVLRERARRAAA